MKNGGKREYQRDTEVRQKARKVQEKQKHWQGPLGRLLAGSRCRR